MRRMEIEEAISDLNSYFNGNELKRGSALQAANIINSLLEELEFWKTVSYNVCMMIDDRAALIEKIRKSQGHIIWKERTTGGFKYQSCPKCGATITVEKPIESKVPYCSKCGKRLDDRFTNFCSYCGAEIIGNEEA